MLLHSTDRDMRQGISLVKCFKFSQHFFLSKLLQQKYITPGALVSFLHALFSEVSRSSEMESQAQSIHLLLLNTNSGVD